MPWCDKTCNLQSAAPIVAERKGPLICVFRWTWSC